MSALALPPRQDSPLAPFMIACCLLAEACTLDEVKAIVDLAEAARVYARQARLGQERPCTAIVARWRGRAQSARCSRKQRRLVRSRASFRIESCTKLWPDNPPCE